MRTLSYAFIGCSLLPIQSGFLTILTRQHRPLLDSPYRTDADRLKGVKALDVKKQAARRLQPTHRTDCPQWGIAEQPRTWGEHTRYRGGQPDVLNEYIIAPKCLPVLDYGVTRLDLIVCACVIAFMVLLWQVIGAGIDGYLSIMGW